MSNSTVSEASPSVPPSSVDVGPKKSPLWAPSKKTVSLLVVVPVIVLASIVAYRWIHPARSAFRTVRVVRADITEHVTATGTLQPVITSPVGAQVSGIVWKLHADFNSLVKAGQLLVELDPALFKNAVSLATAQLAQAESNLTSAQATALGAKSQRDRTLKLERDSLATEADIDSTAAIFGQTQGLARSSVAQIAQARAQLDLAKLNLEHSVIRSPVDGTVISRNVDVGQAVAAALTAPTLFTIAQDLRHMQVHAAVDEADVGEVHPGQGATFTVDAFRNQTFSAVVLQVRNAAVTTQNVVTYDTVLDVDNLEGKLRPGMTANVLILIVHKSSVLVVPNEALRFRPAALPSAAGSVKVSTADARLGAAVYVPQGHGALRVPIKIGVTDGNMTEVEGLQPGREVIIDVARDKGKAPSAGGTGRGI
jgi:HlyD family secretion protein